jgi:transcriptional regulator with XRE-family HTH domain
MNTYDAIRKLRVLGGFKQTQLAEALKITQPEYSKIENGKRKKISVELVKKLSEFYNIDIDVFFK